MQVVEVEAEVEVEEWWSSSAATLMDTPMAVSDTTTVRMHF
jgi:hypothetical protein